ncbi:MAG: hypothetical protein AAF652_08590 [Cyanobacteria bacterium P01_C01_bin.72]
MDIKDKIAQKPIQPNDPRGFAGYDINGLIRQPQRMAERDSLTIAGLAPNKVYEIDMINYLGHDLLITGLSADIVSDDAKTLQQGNQRPNYTTVQVIIQLLERSNHQVKREIVVFISSYDGSIQNDLILSADGLYRIKVNQAVNDITILGKPVVVGEPKIAYNLPEIAPSQQSRVNR